MYDSVNFRLMQADVGGVNFLSEIPCYLENVGEHYFKGGEEVVTGDLQGLKVSLNRHQMKVKDGSLCKWYMGNNFQTMGRGDVQRAIEALSDALHVPMDKATVTRLDIAQNFVLKHPAETYLNHLGLLRYHRRCSMAEIGSLYYAGACGRLCFYDKVREQKSKHGDIPELYEGRNVLRYEQRYTKRLASQLHVQEVTGALLHDEAFYIGIVDRWKETYTAIQKINDVTLNFKAMTGKQQLYKMGLLSLVEQAGGQLQMIEQINEAQKRGELSKKQAFDMREAIKEACKCKEGLTVQSDAIAELDRKVSESVKYYR